MCERLGVMQNGEMVEEMTVHQLRAATPQHPYTQRLLTASAGYDRRAVEELCVALFNTSEFIYMP